MSQPPADALFPMREFLANRPTLRPVDQSNAMKTPEDEFSSQPIDGEGNETMPQTTEFGESNVPGFGENVPGFGENVPGFGENVQTIGLIGGENENPQQQEQGEEKTTTTNFDSNFDSGSFLGTSAPPAECIPEPSSLTPTDSSAMIPISEDFGIMNPPSSDSFNPPPLQTGEDFFGNSTPIPSETEPAFGFEKTPDEPFAGGSTSSFSPTPSSFSSSLSGGLPEQQQQQQTDSPLGNYSRKHQLQIQQKEEESQLRLQREKEDAKKETKEFFEEREKRTSRNREKHTSSVSQYGLKHELDESNPWANIRFLVDLESERKEVSRMREVFVSLI